LADGACGLVARQRIRAATPPWWTPATPSTRLSLNPSLLQDLMRFDAAARPGEGLEMLEVMAAAVRHSRALLLHVEHEHRVIPVTLFPTQRQVHAPLNLTQLLSLDLPALRVLHVEPARINAVDHAAELSPLGPLLWELRPAAARLLRATRTCRCPTCSLAPGLQAHRAGASCCDGAATAARNCCPMLEAPPHHACAATPLAACEKLRRPSRDRRVARLRPRTRASACSTACTCRPG
jgi:hypothetical protein